MDILLTLIYYSIMAFGILTYLGLCVFAIWVINYKKKWQMILTGLGALVFTPILFLVVWLPIQYLYDKKTGNMENVK